MNPLWERKKEFNDFLKNTVSKTQPAFVALYSNVVLVESYFEFITRMLLEQFVLTPSQERNWKQATAIDQLAGRHFRIINQDDKEILKAVCELRNKIVHNIRYEPDISTLKDLKRKITPSSNWDDSDEARFQDSEALYRETCHQIVIAYAKITHNYERKVDQKIVNYVLSQQHP